MQNNHASLFAVYSLLVVGSLVMAMVSCFDLTFLHHVTLLSLDTVFFLMEASGVKVAGVGLSLGWPLAAIYIVFHTLIISASGISSLLLTSYYPETHRRKGRLAVAFALSFPAAWIIGPYLFFGVAALGLIMIAAVAKWSQAERYFRFISMALLTSVGALYLTMLLLLPTVAPNEMP